MDIVLALVSLVVANQVQVGAARSIDPAVIGSCNPPDGSAPGCVVLNNQPPPQHQQANEYSRGCSRMEIAGALKNVLAIPRGIDNGMNLGNNSMAALVAQGFSEI
ncbi:hypothetical protein Ddye_032058 [Dipteronia dyeriana]|uniref:glycerol-3-phosphate dehydrogenase (NAD(+)) n=1 Tax=Dipteronia dyeriana TaxID=168575 RepID=A0AAD9TK62_9ROSI|nr:hypothetical protein Ddye_032058 [Dipteronia dyeriana]